MGPIASIVKRNEGSTLLDCFVSGFVYNSVNKQR
jgi:hypothetical protein